MREFPEAFFALPQSCSSNSNSASTPGRTEIRLTYLGNAGWEITDGKTYVLTDSVIAQFRGNREAKPGQRDSSIFSATTRKLATSVQMPELGGLEVIGAVGPQQMPFTVFVTAYDQHAIRAFPVDALDYLLKPFSEERYEAAMARLKARLN